MYFIYMTSYAWTFVHMNAWHHRPALVIAMPLTVRPR